MKKKIAVLGAGAWGLAVAQSLAKEHQVVVWGHEKAPVLQTTRQSTYLPGITLHESLYFTSSLREARRGSRSSHYWNSFHVYLVPCSTISDSFEKLS